MRKRLNLKRVSAISATLGAAGVGLAVMADAAAAQTGVVDLHGLLRLLDFYDLNPLF